MTEIPGEVLDEADTLDFDKRDQFIAAWARKEALGEAVDWARGTYVSQEPTTDLQRAWAAGVGAVIDRLERLEGNDD